MCSKLFQNFHLLNYYLVMRKHQVFTLSLLQVRDYIHVVDLADGHIAALRKVDDPSIGILFSSGFAWPFHNIVLCFNDIIY